MYCTGPIQLNPKQFYLVSPNLFEKTTTMSFLLFGSSGWIGSQLKQLLETQGKIVHCSTARLENREHIQRYQPSY